MCIHVVIQGDYNLKYSVYIVEIEHKKHGYTPLTCKHPKLMFLRNIRSAFNNMLLRKMLSNNVRSNDLTLNLASLRLCYRIARGGTTRNANA